MLDNGLPFDGVVSSSSYLKISLPSTMSAFTVATGDCFAWALGEDLVAPILTTS